jgi:hypothetical protein
LRTTKSSPGPAEKIMPGSTRLSEQAMTIRRGLLALGGELLEPGALLRPGLLAELPIAGDQAVHRRGPSEALSP